METESYVVSPRLENLPEDAVDLLLSFLSMDDYTRLSAVSTRVRTLVSEASHLLMEDTILDPTLSPKDKSFKVFVRLSLDQSRLHKILRRFHSLNVVRLENLSEVGDKLLSIINAAPSASNLNSLVVSGANLTYWCVDSFELPNLKKLTIAGGSVRTSISSLVGSTSQLESLTIDRSNFVRDDQIMDVTGRMYGSLKYLQLRQCLRIRSPVLCLANLKSLRLIGCFGLTGLPHLDCPNLSHLDLSFCFHMESNAVHAAIEALPNLECLQLVKCPRLEHLTISSDKLRVLNMQMSRNVRFCKLQCPLLEQLETAGCRGLQSLILGSTEMRVLDLSSLPLTRLELYVRNLKYLDVSCCRQLDQTLVRCGT